MQEQDDKQPKKNNFNNTKCCGLMQEQDDKQLKSRELLVFVVVV